MPKQNGWFSVKSITLDPSTYVELTVTKEFKDHVGGSRARLGEKEKSNAVRDYKQTAKRDAVR